MMRFVRVVFAASVACATVSGCGQGKPAVTASTVAVGETIPLTIATARGNHVFDVEVARTPETQEKGLMFRTDIPKDGGMIFTPYPVSGGPPQVARFWMKNTPSALDLIFIRADGTVASIAENAVPFSETPVGSTEPVAAVLEILGGRAAEVGIAEGDKVSWAK